MSSLPPELRNQHHRRIVEYGALYQSGNSGGVRHINL